MKKLLLCFIFTFSLLYSSFTAEAANQYDILINEVAWMGDTNSQYHEWIELLNNTDNSIDLSGWALQSGDQKLKISLEKIIPPKGFYLLERTDDNSVPGVNADVVYRGSLSNGGVNLKLIDNANSIIDQAYYETGWPAGDNKTKQTMEGLNITTWQTSQNPNGTPKTKNSRGIVLPTPNVAQTTTYPDGVFINEVLPSPEGKDELDEWIELYNSNAFGVNLFNWQLKDAEGTITTYTLPKESKITANGYLVLKRPQTKIVLNNDKEALYLIRPDGKITSSVAYEAVLGGQSYNKMGSVWYWSDTLTPGSLNATNTIKKEARILADSQQSDNKTDVGEAGLAEPINQFLSNWQEEKNIKPKILLFITGGIIIITGVGITLWKLRSKT